MSDNRLSSGLDNLLGCPNLTHLNLSGNKIKDLEVLSALSQLTNLRNVDLFNCDVTHVDDYREKIFKLLPQLKYLDGFDQNEQEEDEFEDDEGGSDDDEDEDDEGEEDEDDEEGDEDEVEGDEDDEDDDDEDEDEDEGDEDENDEDVLLATKKLPNGGLKPNGAANAAAAKADNKSKKVRHTFWRKNFF